MKYLARLCVCALTGVVLFVGLSRVLGWWSGQEMTLLQLTRSVVLESRRTEALRQRAETLAYSLTIKKAIVAEILAGRLTLHESAPQFKEANELLIDNGDSDLLATYYIPATNEAVCEQVLTWVWGETALQYDDTTKKIVKGLEREFQEMFGKPCPDLGSPEEARQNEADAPEGEASAPRLAG